MITHRNVSDLDIAKAFRKISAPWIIHIFDSQGVATQLRLHTLSVYHSPRVQRGPYDIAAEFQEISPDQVRDEIGNRPIRPDQDEPCAHLPFGHLPPVPVEQLR